MQTKNGNREPMIVSYQGKEDNNIICDITWGKPHSKTMIIDNKKKVVRIPPRKDCGIKLKLGNNPELLEKVKKLRRRSSIYISLDDVNGFSNKDYQGTVTGILTKKEYTALYKIEKEKAKELEKKNKPEK